MKIFMPIKTTHLPSSHAWYVSHPVEIQPSPATGLFRNDKSFARMKSVYSI